MQVKLRLNARTQVKLRLNARTQVKLRLNARTQVKLRLNARTQVQENVYCSNRCIDNKTNRTLILISKFIVCNCLNCFFTFN